MKTELQVDIVVEQSIKLLYSALQVAEGQLEKRGLQFGQAMYEYRERHSAQGRRTDLVLSETKSEPFEGFCDRLGIVRSTAYRWIARYEESIGTRLPKPNPAQATSRDVSPSDPADNLLPLKSEPEPILTAPTSTPVVSREEKDREQLRFLANRLDSVSIALQQVIYKKAKWSKCEEEYAEVVSLVEKIADLVKLL